MRQLYKYISEHIYIILSFLMLWLIPDFLFKGWVLSVHVVAITVVIVIVLLGEVLDWDYYDEPCDYCEEIDNLPEAIDHYGFAIMDGMIMFSDKKKWYATDIDYCPMCGRRMEHKDV